MRVLLIDPPFYRLIGFSNRYYPMGLCSLGAFLEQQGHTVAVHDHDANSGPGRLDYANQAQVYQNFVIRLQNLDHPIWQEVIAQARAFKPDVIGISLLTPKIGSGIRVGRQLRQALPGIPIVLGGTHPTVQPDETLSWGIADLVVRGEGEETFAELLTAISGSRNLADICGLSYRDSDGSIRHNPDRPLIEDLDRLPPPGRHLLLHLDRYTGEDLGLIMTSRGCPYHCRFCSSHSIWTNRARFRSLEHVDAEIALIRQRYGVSAITLKDDSFTVHRQRVLAWCHLYQKKWRDVPWECVTRLDLIDEDLLHTMKQAGCVTVKVGVETGSPRMLAAIDKGETLERMQQGAHLLQRSGIFWSAYFLIGLPGEAEEDLQASLKILSRFSPDFAAVGIYEPFPGTPLFQDGVERGLFVPAMTAESILTTNPDDYYLQHPGVHTDQIAPEKFSRLSRQFIDRVALHNRRPRAIFRRLRTRLAQYRIQPGHLGKDALAFFHWYFSR